MWRSTMDGELTPKRAEYTHVGVFLPVFASSVPISLDSKAMRSNGAVLCTLYDLVCWPVNPKIPKRGPKWCAYTM